MKKLMFMLLTLFFTATVYAGGLSSNWGEVVVEHVFPGQEYDLNKALGVPFQITNNFDTAVTLKLEALKPTPEELKRGYEAVPDEDWISVPQAVEIKAGEKKEISIVLRLPDDEKLQNRKFHVWVWSYTSGQAVGVGLKSRILINVAGKKQ